MNGKHLVAPSIPVQRPNDESVCMLNKCDNVSTACVRVYACLGLFTMSFQQNDVSEICSVTEKPKLNHCKCNKKNVFYDCHWDAWMHFVQFTLYYFRVCVSVCVFVYHRSWKCILYATKLFKTFSNVQEHIKHIKMFIMRSHFISSLEIGPRIYHILITTNYPEHLFGIWELMKI